MCVVECVRVGGGCGALQLTANTSDVTADRELAQYAHDTSTDASARSTRYKSAIVWWLQLSADELQGCKRHDSLIAALFYSSHRNSPRLSTPIDNKQDHLHPYSLTSTTMPSECVRVSVRCRPMNTSERQRGCQKIVVVDHQRMAIEIKKPDVKKDSTLVDSESDRQFTFDSVFDDNSLQSEVYEHTAYDLVKQVMQGYNGTIFAYGQTGCGKTFTMEGVRNTTDPELKGIIPTTFQQIFTSINTENNMNVRKQFLVRTSYIEIYNEEVRDLLSDNPKQRLDVKEDSDKGIYVKNLIQVTVDSIEQIEELMFKGNNNRSVGATLMNADSSRSHSLFTITIETCEPAEVAGAKDKIRVGKLNLVDLAGSERQSKTQASGQRLKEATKINLSLSALGNVISALVTNSGSNGE